MKLRRGSPTGLLEATLTGPSELDTGGVGTLTPIVNHQFTPNKRVTLLPLTTYWVVGTGNTSAGWASTFSDDEDEGAAEGWSISDDLGFRNAGSSDAFLPKPSFSPLAGIALKMRVNGSPLTSLVSNVGQAELGRLSLPISDVAQSFTTGSRASGYVMTHVELRINAGSTTRPSVQLRRGSPTGVLIANLTAPAEMRNELGTSSYVFTPPSPVTLNHSTTYWVMVTNHHSGAVAVTTSDDEDAGAAPGWSIGDEVRTRDAGTTNTYRPILIRTFKDTAAIMRIGGLPLNAAEGAPEITVPNVLRVPAVLGVDLSGISDGDGTSNIADNATYKWQRIAEDGTTLLADAIGSEATYKLTDDDAEKRIRVEVSFTDDDDNSRGPAAQRRHQRGDGGGGVLRCPPTPAGRRRYGPARWASG